MSTNKGSKSFLFGAIAGGIVGSITALLFAPKAGKELRQDVSTQATKVSDAAVQTANKVSDATTNLAKDIGNRASQLADKTKQATCHVTNSIRQFRPGGAEKEEMAVISSEEQDTNIPTS